MNRMKVNARASVHYALKTGKIRKSELCQKCGIKSELQFHHTFGYEKENRLRGWFLCESCHKDEEKKKEQLLLFPEPKKSIVNKWVEAENRN